jgi:flagellar basal body-associated protein FliL
MKFKSAIIILSILIATTTHAGGAGSYVMTQVTKTPDGKEVATSKRFVTPTAKAL